MSEHYDPDEKHERMMGKQRHPLNPWWWLEINAPDWVQGELAQEKEALEQQLAEWDETMRVVMAEECASDERHCTCVPYLRKALAEKDKEIERLKQINRESVALIDYANQHLPEGYKIITRLLLQTKNG